MDGYDIQDYYLLQQKCQDNNLLSILIKISVGLIGLFITSKITKQTESIFLGGWLSLAIAEIISNLILGPI